MSKVYTVSGFEFGYIKSAKDMAGTMSDFEPHWWVQYLGNGESSRFSTKQECLDWIKEWNEVSN